MSAAREPIERLARALARFDGYALDEDMRVTYLREARRLALALDILRPLPAHEAAFTVTFTSDDAPGVLAVQVPPDAPDALAAEAGRCGDCCPCGQCLPCVLPPGHEGDHDDGDRTYDHDATRAEIERLRGELGRLTYAAERADDVAIKSQESRLTSLDDARRLVAERDAARAELVAAQDVASRRYGDIQDLRYELKDARAELARLRAPVWTEATREAVGKVAREMGTMGAAPENIAWAAVEAYFAALAQGAPPEGER